MFQELSGCECHKDTKLWCWMIEFGCGVSILGLKEILVFLKWMNTWQKLGPVLPILLCLKMKSSTPKNMTHTIWAEFWREKANDCRIFLQKSWETTTSNVREVLLTFLNNKTLRMWSEFCRNKCSWLQLLTK